MVNVARERMKLVILQAENDHNEICLKVIYDDGPTHFARPDCAERDHVADAILGTFAEWRADELALIAEHDFFGRMETEGLDAAQELLSERQAWIGKLRTLIPPGLPPGAVRLDLSAPNDDGVITPRNTTPNIAANRLPLGRPPKEAE